MGFFDRGKGPTATPSRTGASGGGGSKGNKGEGNAKDGYPFGSTTPGYIDYRDIEANGPFYPGTTRQRYQDDPNARSLHTPGSDRRSQLDQWIADGNPTGIDHPRSPSRARGDMPLEGVVSPEEFARRDAQIAQRRADTMGKLQGMQAFQSNFGGMDLNDPAVQRQIRSDPAKYAEWKRQLSVAKLGLPEDWRLSGTGITPRSRNGQYWYRPPGAQGPNDPGLPGPTPPGVAQSAPQGGGALNDPGFSKSPRMGGAGGIQGFLGDGAVGQGPTAVAAGALPEWAKGQTGPQSDVLAALSRLQGMPLGAPTAATGAMGGFGRAASGIAPAMAAASAAKKPTMVRRGGGVVSVR